MKWIVRFGLTGWLIVTMFLCLALKQSTLAQDELSNTGQPELIEVVVDLNRSSLRDGNSQYGYHLVWRCVGTPGYYCSGSSSNVTHKIYKIAPPNAQVVYVEASPAQGYCNITTETDTFCNLGTFIVGSTVTVYFTVSYTPGTVAFYHSATSSLGTWYHEEQLGAPPCVDVNKVRVCADDLVGNDDGTIYTGTSNITLGNAISVSGGTITANLTAGRVKGSGQLVFQAGQTAIPFWNGDFNMNAGDTGSGILTVNANSSGFLLEELSNVKIAADRKGMKVHVNVATGYLLVNGGKLVLNVPVPLTIDLVRYDISSAGKVSGNVKPFKIDLGVGMRVRVEEANFNEEGLVSTGKVFVFHLGIADPAPFDGIVFTTDDLRESKSDKHTSLEGSGVNFAALGRIDLGILQVKFGLGKFELGNFRNQGNELTFSIKDVLVKLDKRLFPSLKEFAFTGDFRIYKDDVEIEKGTLELPTITVFGIRVVRPKVGLEKLPDNEGFAITGEGAIEIVNLVKPKLGDPERGFFLRLSVTLKDNQLDWREIYAELRGIELPLGAQPVVYLKTFGGGVEIDGDEGIISGLAGLRAGSKFLADLLGVEILSGTADIEISSLGKVLIAGTLTLFEKLDAAEAELKLDFAGSLYGSFQINALDVLIGKVSAKLAIHSPYLTGRGRLQAQIPFDKLPKWLQIFLPDEPLVLGQVNGYLGAFQDSYGIGANAQVRLTDDYNWETCVFVDYLLNLNVNCGWVDAPYAPQVTAYEHNADRIQVTFAGNSDLSLPLEQIGSGVASAIFYLDAANHPALVLVLEDPNGNVITPANVGSFPNIVFGNQNGGMAYFVDNPTPGEWILQVEGLQGGENYTTGVILQDAVPEITLTGVTSNNGAHTINWEGSDLENDATVSVYYDIDDEGYDGNLIAEGLSLASGQYIWTGAETPTGTYYVYVQVEDDQHMPEVSNYSQALQVVDNTAPAVPTGVTAMLDASEVVVSWSPNSELDLAGYRVKILHSSNPENIEQIDVLETELRFERIDPSQDLTITLQAYDISNNLSAPSTPVVIEKSIEDEPGAPTNLVAVLIDEGVALNWQAPTAGGSYEGYRLYYGYDNNTAFLGKGANEGDSPIALNKVLNLTLTGLDPQRKLKVFVVAYDSQGNESERSNIVTIRTKDILTAPSNLTALSISDTQIDLNWTDNSVAEDAYMLERSKNGTTWATIANLLANTTSFSDTGIDCQTTYHYRVRAYRSTTQNIFSKYSNVVQATTQTCVTKNLVRNGGFETQGNSGKTALQWTMITPPRAKRTCNQSGQPAIAKNGICALDLKGKGKLTVAATQAAKAQLGASGDTVVLQGWVWGQDIKKAKVVAKIYYTDGAAPTQLQFDADALLGTYGYKSLTANTVLAGSIKKVKLNIAILGKGRLRVDDISLVWTSATALDLPLIEGMRGGK